MSITQAGDGLGLALSIGAQRGDVEPRITLSFPTNDLARAVDHYDTFQS
jgi:hypothetical protein